ncbi:MAG: hypothetical protein CVT88_09080 [Candidatus Altiarchaeales archaeon HGW-Altiarchaeales-1]|nr:MAG: hypothetical protein CVT88_09080 [Candidatus Altiarchaeales archaeon HGW-Altiarchaeales-1]PKP57799.1 MAG: hypothetical protein CVT89_03890 [Candidatus Altiarchaeales archaeon HGW-Altiarchaeales-2]
MYGKRQTLIFDSSTLIGCEKAEIFSNYSEKLSAYFELCICKEAYEELRKGKSKENMRIQNLIKSNTISILNDAKVSTAACETANKYNLDLADVSGLILAKKLNALLLIDDIKFFRQKFTIKETILDYDNYLPFSFILLTLFKLKLIDDNTMRMLFCEIIKKNNWKRSEVEKAANELIHIELGYYVVCHDVITKKEIHELK